MIFTNCTPQSKLVHVEQEVATAIAEVAYFISPKVARRIADLNFAWQTEFEENFGSKVHTPHYFYSSSACVFPGVRRHSSEADRKLKKFLYHEAANAILDDNTFPRQLWSFLCTGKKYSGQNWKKSGLGQFELAHVLPHKAYEMTGVNEWFVTRPAIDGLHGLFTCAANIILLPKGMARPTDGTAGIRLAVFKRYFDLYGEIYAGGFGGIRLPDRLTWLDGLHWNDPIEPQDWELRIAELDKFRKEKIRSLLAQRMH